MEGQANAPLTDEERESVIDKEIRAWGRITRSQLIGQVLSLNLEGRAQAAIDRLTNGEEAEQPLIDTINYHTKREDGILNRVAIRFARHGTYLERGVGKGRKVGSAAANRSAQPWLAPILPAAAEVLANRLAESYADVAAKEVVIRIPGLHETEIRK